MDSFEQASEIKFPKLVTKYQNDSKAEFTGSPSKTESDSDSTKGLKVKTKCQPALLFIQVKTISSLCRLQNQLIMKSHRKFLVSYICHTELIIYIRKFTILNILGQIPY